MVKTKVASKKRKVTKRATSWKSCYERVPEELIVIDVLKEAAEKVKAKEASALRKKIKDREGAVARRKQRRDAEMSMGTKEKEKFSAFLKDKQANLEIRRLRNELKAVKLEAKEAEKQYKNYLGKKEETQKKLKMGKKHFKEMFNYVFSSRGRGRDDHDRHLMRKYVVERLEENDHGWTGTKDEEKKFLEES